MAVDRENRIRTATVDGLFLIEGLAARQITRVGMSQVAIEQDSLFHLGWKSGAGELALFRSPITAQGLGPAKLLLRGRGKFFQDAKGRLWLPCGERVCVVEDPAGQARVTELGVEQGLPAQYWRAAVQDRRGHTWVVSTEQVWVRRKGQARFALFDYAKQDLAYPLRMSEDSQGTFWLGFGNGTYWEDGDGAHRTKQPNLLLSTEAFGVFADRDGSRWMASREGLVRWIGAGQVQTWPDTGISFSVIEAQDGSRWAVTSKGVAWQSPDENEWRPLLGTETLGVLRHMRPAGPHTVLFVSQASEVYAVDTRTRQWTKARIRETAAMTLPREPLVTPSRMLGEPLADGTWPILPLPGKPSMLARDARQDAEKRLWVMSRTGPTCAHPAERGAG